MSADHFGLVALLVLFGVVAVGAIVPVLPTGAAVSATAVLAADSHLWEVPLVVAVGGAAAWVGDVTTYAVLRRAGEPLARRVGWLRPDDPETRLHRLRESIEEHELRTLLVSRLVPGGRVPVLLVASLTGYPARRFASAAVGAATLWAVVYAAIGLAGGSLLADTTTAVVVAVLAALLLSLGSSLAPALRRRLGSSGAPSPGSGPGSAPGSAMGSAMGSARRRRPRAGD